MHSVGGESNDIHGDKTTINLNLSIYMYTGSS